MNNHNYQIKAETEYSRKVDVQKIDFCILKISHHSFCCFVCVIFISLLFLVPPKVWAKDDVKEELFEMTMQELMEIDPAIIGSGERKIYALHSTTMTKRSEPDPDKVLFLGSQSHLVGQIPH